MINTKLEEDLGLEYDLVETVMSSLRTNQVDYCFNIKSFNAILNLAKEQGINLVYKMVEDRYGQLDYVEFIPTNFYMKTASGKRKYIDGIYQYSHTELPVNWKYEHKKYSNKPKETKTKRKTIDYLAKSQGKDYLF